MKKMLSLALAAALAMAALSAQAKSLVLVLSDSTEVYYLLAGDVDPRMTWADGTVTVNSDDYALSDFVKFFISDTDDPSGIQDIAAADQPTFSAGVMRVKGTPEVRVFTMDGRAVQAQASSDGNVTTLDTNALPAGAYVVTFGKGSLKFHKK